MDVVVTADGNNLDAQASPFFGRCPAYIFVDTDTLDFESVENPAASTSGGAGIQAAQFVIEHGARAVLTGNVGPNAADVLRAAGVPVYQHQQGTVREVVEMFKQNQLAPLSGSSAPPHTGMGGGRGMGSGQGMGMGRGIGPPSDRGSRQEEVEALRRTADELRRQLDVVIDRLEEMEEDS